MDRISQLPQPILHHILSYLSPHQAIRTCTLSKSWRYIGSTHPNVELRQSFFKGNQRTFFSVLDNTLNRYHAQNLSIQDFLLEISSHVNNHPKYASLLEKWITVVVLNMRVKTFNLNFRWNYLPNFADYPLRYFNLPLAVFQAESLQELHLGGCKFLSGIDHENKVLFNHLRTLSLTRVAVSDETFERIISSCPLIELLTLNYCQGLETIKVNKVPNLKYFGYKDDAWPRRDDAHSIEIDAPSVESISIKGRANCFHSSNYLSFAHLKSLYLSYVRLSEDSFHRFSVDFCCLEDLALSFCHDFEEFKLTSRSIKNLTLEMSKSVSKADIDVPNIICFEFACFVFPSISFTTTSSEWKSKISILSSKLNRCCASSMLLEVYEFHKAALSHSEFSLHIKDPLVFVLKNDANDLYPPSAVVIKNLSIGMKQYSFSSLGAFLSRLFCFFHPRNIKEAWDADPKNMLKRDANHLSKCFPGIIQDLEEVSVENGGEPEPCGLRNNHMQMIIHYRLKWRGL